MYRVPIRVKTVLLLWAPMAALFASLFSLFWVETEVNRADQAVVEADQLRAGVIRQIHEALDREAQALADLRNQRGSPAQVFAAREALDRLEAIDRVEEDRLLHARQIREVARRRLLRVLLVCAMVGPLAALLINLLAAGR